MKKSTITLEEDLLKWLPRCIGEIIAHVTFFLLWHIPDYATFVAIAYGNRARIKRFDAENASFTLHNIAPMSDRFE